MPLCLLEAIIHAHLTRSIQHHTHQSSLNSHRKKRIIMTSRYHDPACLGGSNLSASQLAIYRAKVAPSEARLTNTVYTYTPYTLTISSSNDSAFPLRHLFSLSFRFIASTHERVIFFAPPRLYCNSSYARILAITKARIYIIIRSYNTQHQQQQK